MTTFDNRERGDAQEVKAEARRSQLLGLWAGGLMGLEEQHLQDYAAAVARSETSRDDSAAVLRKVAQDLSGAGLKVSEDQVRGKMDELLALARGQLEAGA